MKEVMRRLAAVPAIPSDEYDDGIWTECPWWCDHPEHDGGSGKWHQGATVVVAASVPNRGRVDSSVEMYEPYGYVIDISAETTLTKADAQRLIAGLIDAVALIDPLTDEAR